MTRSIRDALIVLFAALSALAGCQANLPEYPPMADDTALRMIAERLETVTSLSSEFDLSLTDAKGQTINLDGALVVQTPGMARVRAWKFGHAVFDLTLVKGDAWLFAPDRQPDSLALDAETIPARRMNEAIELLGPRYFRAAKPFPAATPMLMVRGPAMGSEEAVCQIERRTLTPRRFVVGERGGAESSEIVLDQYSMVSGIAWPTVIRLRSPKGEMIFRFRGVELNGGIPPGALTPPKSAKRLP
jgi:hypothetical protein